MTTRQAAVDRETTVTTPPTEMGLIVDLLRQAGHLSSAQIRHATRVQAKLVTPRTLLEVLQQLAIIETATIAAVVRANPDAVELAPLLVELGYVHESQLQTLAAVQAREKRHTRLGEALVEARLLTESRLVHVYADLYGFPLVEPRPGTVDRSLLSRAMVRRYAEGGFVPMRREAGKVVVAFADPLDRELRAAVRLALGTEVVATVARRTMILDVIQAFERGGRNTVATEEAGGGPMVSLADQLIRDALHAGASDIHVDPLSARLRVRFRIDGVLVDQQELGKEVAPSLASRLKVLAGADITEKRRHQGGRFLFEDGTTFLVSSTVISIVAQRLLRRICRACAEPYTPSAAEWRRVGWTPEDPHGARFARGGGCPTCRFTGYRGRVCVFELLVLNEMVKNAILNRQPSYEIRKISLETSGLVTLLEDGLIKAAQGVTTLTEVLRNLPRLAKPRAFDPLTRLTGVA